MKSKLLVYSTLLILFALILPSLHILSAQTMTNSNYKLEQGNFNSVAGQPTNTEKKLIYTDNPSLYGVYSGTNYTVTSGFVATQGSSGTGGTTGTSFTFSISNKTINFGKLNAGEPISRTNTLTVSGSGAYQILGSENTPLKKDDKTHIPDTTCDSGNCSEVTSGEWSSPLSYGFGFRCDSIKTAECGDDFLNPDFFKQFANNEAHELPQTIFSKNSSTDSSQSKITYKVNVSGTQSGGIYQNTIIYIAVPSL